MRSSLYGGEGCRVGSLGKIPFTDKKKKGGFETMNKNLKKVISAVAALSLSASSIAALAVDYSDVDSSASYAKAVNELSSLNIINGYEDGTFKPDGLVTRAEITKMIVAALGETSAAEAAEGQNTQFGDVTGEHWASGFVTQGVSNGFINGYSATEFGPEDNVTYVQAQKMLVAAIGYGTYAEANGGWPSGYKMYANSLDITSGISGIGDNTELTRAQVAQMIDNAIDAPLCEVERYETDSWTGQLVPVLKTMDGTGKNYQTLLTRKHNAYKVYGRVTDTSKTTSMDTDVVNFQVEKADNFDDQYVKSSEPKEPQEMYIGTSKADEYLRVYSEALIQKDDNDEYTILSLTPAAASKSVTLAAEDFDTDKIDYIDTNNTIYFHPAGSTRGSVKYELADSVDYYVNGVKMDGTFNSAAATKFIAGNETATVTLQKETEIGSTGSSTKYNVIMITAYETAVVDEVLDKTSYTSINFKEQSKNIVKNTMRIEKDDDSYTYTFTLNGEAIAPEDLQEFDVLNIAYDRSGEDKFENSRFYEVIVTRDTAEGKCTSINSDGDEFTIGGTKYSIAQGMSITPEMSASYFLYLDAFGNIAALDEDASSKKLGILKQVYKKANGDWVAIVITNTGVEEEYKVDLDNIDYGKISEGVYGPVDPDKVGYNEMVADYDATKKEDAYPAQVIDYKVSSSSNKITINEVMNAVESGEEEYKASSDKIGSVRLSDASIIIDISDVNNKDAVRVISKDSLTDGQTYEAYGYDKSSTDSTYRFVLITGTGDVTSETQMAIFNGREVVEDGDDERDAFNVIVDGKEDQVLLDEDVVGDADFQEGDAIVFSTNAAGYVTNIYNVFDNTNALNAPYNALSDEDKENTTPYKEFRDMVLSTDVNDIIDENLAGKLSDSNETVDMLFGPVVNKNGNFVTIGTVGEYTDKDGKEHANSVNYGIDATEIDCSEAKVYTYNFAGSSKYSKVILDNGLTATIDSKAARYEDAKGNYILDLTHGDVTDDVVFAVARVIDGDMAQEIYLIVNED